MDETVLIMKEQIIRLEDRIKRLEDGCCGSESNKVRIETSNNLKILTKQFNNFVTDEKEDWKYVNEKIDKLSKIIYIATGAIVVVQIIGLDKVVKVFAG